MSEHTLISYQITIVIAAIISGGMAALFYDIYKLLLPKRQPICRYIVADIVFAVSLFIISALIWFTFTDGSLRLLDCVWFGCGAIIYHVCIKRPFVWLNIILHSRFNRVFSKKNNRSQNAELQRKPSKKKKKSKLHWFENLLAEGFLNIFKAGNSFADSAANLRQKIVTFKNKTDTEDNDTPEDN